MTKRALWPALVIAGTLGIGILLGTLISHSVRADRPARANAKVLGAPTPSELSSSFTRVADTVGPAVVNIKTQTDVRLGRHHPGSREEQPQDEEPFDGFFNRFFHFGPAGSLPEKSLGSGVVLDPAGYILTNCHVIMRDAGDQPVDLMRVILQGEDDASKGHPAKLVGFDKWTDLAVIKIESTKPLGAAALGNSDNAHVGDWVLAIGSPFGLNSTVTAGIISARGRGIEAGPEGEFKHYLQTDAAINPGNSGGPLVNLAGQVIGINTAIATDHDSYDGVGFAIPSNTVRKIYNDLVRSGQVRRGAIGVNFGIGSNQSVLAAMGTDRGVVVDGVTADGPAEHAGLRLGDVIESVDSKATPTGDELLDVVSEASPGAHLKLDFLRDGKAMSADVVVGDWNKIVDENEPPSSKHPIVTPVDSGRDPLGLSVKNLTADQAKTIARDLRLTSPAGVVVTDARAGSFADDVGLQRYDVILAINHQNVLSVEDFNRIQTELRPGQNVLFLVAEGDQRGFVTKFLADKLP